MKLDIEEEVTPSALAHKLYEFICQYRPITSKKNPERKIKYPNLIRRMYPDRLWMEYDWEDFVGEGGSPSLDDYFLSDPDMFLEALGVATARHLREMYIDYGKEFYDRIHARISYFPDLYGIRDIGSKTTGKFVCVKGMLIRASAIDSLPLKMVYKCEKGHKIPLHADKRHYIIDAKPVVCSNDSCKEREFDLVPTECEFIDYQIIEIQEITDDLPEGETPKTISIFVADDLIGEARLGDIVEVAGIVRVEESKEIKMADKVQTYRHRIYANNITRLTQDKIAKEITPAEETRFQKMIKIEEAQATAKLVSSFASHVHGHDLIKEALILTMIGADAKTLPNGSKIRGDINVLMVGDPGVAKSEMGKSVQRLTPRAFYTSGKGSSAAGLTAAVNRDEVTGRYMLSPGVTALADRGLVVIDEFDKMDTRDRSALHEVMEQQTVSISKAGINASLNTRCSVVAIANPALGKYDPFKNLTENIPSIPIPLLTRFDLIFVIRDTPNTELDNQITDHVLSMYDLDDIDRAPFSKEDFAKYIRIAKSIHPKLSSEAKAKIKEYYNRMRKVDTEGMTITVRQLEGITRLTIARAKMLLKDTADINDAERAIYIMESMLKSSGVDVTTGEVDLGVLHGTPKSEVSKLKLFQDIFKNLRNDDGLVHERDLVDNLVQTDKFDEHGAYEFIEKVRTKSWIFEPKKGWYKTV